MLLKYSSDTARGEKPSDSEPSLPLRDYHLSESKRMARAWLVLTKEDIYENPPEPLRNHSPTNTRYGHSISQNFSSERRKEFFVAVLSDRSVR